MKNNRCKQIKYTKIYNWRLMNAKIIKKKKKNTNFEMKN